MKVTSSHRLVIAAVLGADIATLIDGCGAFALALRSCSLVRQRGTRGGKTVVRTRRHVAFCPRSALCLRDRWVSFDLCSFRQSARRKFGFFCRNRLCKKGVTGGLGGDRGFTGADSWLLRRNMKPRRCGSAGWAVSTAPLKIVEANNLLPRCLQELLGTFLPASSVSRTSAVKRGGELGKAPACADQMTADCRLAGTVRPALSTPGWFP